MVRVLILSILLISLIAGCKPTEKNYKEAYEAAQAKRNAVNISNGVNAPLQGDDSFSIKVVNGDSVWVCHSRISLLPIAGDNSQAPDADSQSLPAERFRELKYGLIVGSFSMPANANALAADLKRMGHIGVPATDGLSKWYVLSDLYPTLDDAIEGSKAFHRENPTYIYVGIPAPLIVYIP